MSNNNISQVYDAVCQAFREYQKSRRRLVKAMAQFGIQTGNVDPYSNFAEVLVAQEFGGAVQPAANAGFDVLTPDGTRIQVKSLRVSAGRPFDNGVGWSAATRTNYKPSGYLIAADKLAIVVYHDGAPYCILIFPVVDCERFPLLNVQGMNFGHVEKLMAGKYADPDGVVEIIDVRERFPAEMAVAEKDAA